MASWNRAMNPQDRRAVHGGRNIHGTGVGSPNDPANNLGILRKKAGEKKKSGWFQYGYGQWGFIGDNNAVDWNANKPRRGSDKTVLSWRDVKKRLPKSVVIPEQKQAPDWFNNPDYLYNKRDLEKGIADRRRDFMAQLDDLRGFTDPVTGKTVKGKYAQAAEAIGSGYKEAVNSMAANMAARGVFRSGGRVKAQADLDNKRNAQLAEADVNFGNAAQARLNEQMREDQLYLTDQLDNLREGAEEIAKDIGIKPPVYNKPFLDKDGLWKIRLTDGTIVSADPKKQKAPPKKSREDAKEYYENLQDKYKEAKSGGKKKADERKQIFQKMKLAEQRYKFLKGKR